MKYAENIEQKLLDSMWASERTLEGKWKSYESVLIAAAVETCSKKNYKKIKKGNSMME